MIIKAGFLISYDYEYLKIALPLIYSCDDISEIYLAIDQDFKTWNGEDFTIPDSFFHWIKDFDTNKKITIYRDNFYVSDLSTIDCDTRERRMLSERMGKCDWYIQIDSDEYIIDIQNFVNKLKQISKEMPGKELSVAGKIVMLFKENSDELYVVKPIKELIWLATNAPAYQYARANLEQELVKTDTLVVHQSWARSEAEISQKIRNWGHMKDFDVNQFYENWRVLDKTNYKNWKNFHPLTPNEWQSLSRIKGYQIKEFNKLSEFQMKTVVKYPFLSGFMKLLG